jgi:DNA mismatch endonuclease (patch repair protein)
MHSGLLVYADIEKIKRVYSARPISVGNGLGTPDFCWKRQKIAVFCDSSFWHGFNWSKEKKKIKVRKSFWYKKIEDNIARDKKVNRKLRKDGWKVFRFWDFKIKKDALLCAKEVTNALARRKKQLKQYI